MAPKQMGVIDAIEDEDKQPSSLINGATIPQRRSPRLAAKQQQQQIKQKSAAVLSSPIEGCSDSGVLNKAIRSESQKATRRKASSGASRSTPSSKMADKQSLTKSVTPDSNGKHTKETTQDPDSTDDQNSTPLLRPRTRRSTDGKKGTDDKEDIPSISGSDRTSNSGSSDNIEGTDRPTNDFGHFEKHGFHARPPPPLVKPPFPWKSFLLALLLAGGGSAFVRRGWSLVGVTLESYVMLVMGTLFVITGLYHLGDFALVLAGVRPLESIDDHFYS